MSSRAQSTTYISYQSFGASSGPKLMSDEPALSVKWLLLAGLMGSVGSALAWQQKSCSLVSCDPDEPADNELVQKERLQRFKYWLKIQGAQVDAVEFAATSEDAGLGMQLSERPAQLRSWRAWIWSVFRPRDVVVARFPLISAITTQSIISQPGVGPRYRELLETGACDERLLTMLFLVVEKLRGEASPLAPWFALLPQIFDTPLHYSQAELAQLQGTTLYNASRLLEKNLQLTWKLLEPVCREVLEKSGAKEVQPTFADFLWAYSVFWSRAQTFPKPDKEGRGQAQEGIVPGLDFCNHGFDAPCRWTVFGARTAGEESPSTIALVARRREVPSVGQEVTISYGDKSNEELLLLYGFTADDNPHDMLMLRCPLPPVSEWGELLRARAALLQQKSLSPQLFLPAAGLTGSQDTKGQQGKAVDRLKVLLPPAAWSTLEVLVMEPRQLAEELKADDSSADKQPATPSSPVEAAGLELAVLTTLVRLLEVKLAELEGPRGTGLLEDDVGLLEGPLSGAGGGKLPGRLRDCVVYRAGQKRIARSYLQLARVAVMEELEHMQQLLRDAEE